MTISDHSLSFNFYNNATVTRMLQMKLTLKPEHTYYNI